MPDRPTTGVMKLSVVVACLGLHERVDAALDALGAATIGIAAEFILVAAGASDAELRSLVERHPMLVCVAVPDGALVPQLWAAGLRRASGDLVALTSSQVTVQPEWAA